ncbi:hypothetical protein N8472_02190 [Gammaproteobacteria bacterium]|nr:hypothetical protein [Gammaproteobacteria bacterium]MDA9153897.1 hypothetical protein [Gammaproteobacteria bacterium]MDA9341272.1 hypothetical protein [Gammaproteobacteria bacterium]MDA9364911.1 hypothetical protein [Gammaproteobacteria bacterium]MDA9371182.1 hypothetical protein [Gammaproteobacteria bacterium]|tara:strand:+ start:2556 stop:2786 length:231 start_codon:yes stop_codon:yes gene_type:complete
MDLNLALQNIKEFITKINGVLIPLVSVSLLLGIIFGPSTPVVGEVYTNVATIIKMLGEDGLLALISIIIILAYLKK